MEKSDNEEKSDDEEQSEEQSDDESGTSSEAGKLKGDALGESKRDSLEKSDNEEQSEEQSDDEEQSEEKSEDEVDSGPCLQNKGDGLKHGKSESEGESERSGEAGVDSDCDSVYSFDTVPTHDRTVRGFRNATGRESTKVMAEYVIVDDDQLHYLEWCGQVVSINREYETRHGPRFSTYSYFPKDQDNTKAETCHRLGIPYFKTQRMCGIRVNICGLDPALEEVSERVGVVDYVVMMNFLIRMTGSKVYRSNLHDSVVEGGGRVRHLKLRLTDLPEDTGLLLKGPFLHEVSKVAQFCWATHKHFHQAEEPERMESASESSVLRKVLLVDPRTETMGFSDCTVELFEPVGEVEWDASTQFKDERYPDKYQWTMFFTMSSTREIDGRLFLLLFKFHYGKWSVYDRM